jgi:DUF1680 family protein
MLRLTRMLFETAPAAAYADYYERALYNGILGSQDPDTGMVTYFQPTRPGYLKIYCTPIDSFWCCTGSGMESHAKYADSAYFHTDDELYINLFMPSTLRWQQKKITLTQTTLFPDLDKSRLTIGAARPTTFRLQIRHPYWCDTVNVRVNGMVHRTSTSASTYIEVDREWNDGDVVEIDLPMHLRTEPLPGSPDIVALLYGPMVLAGRLGHAGIQPGADIVANERTIGEMLNEPLPLPELELDTKDPSRQMRRTDASKLRFTATLLDQKRLEFIPYQQIAHERYNLYWRLARA